MNYSWILIININLICLFFDVCLIWPPLPPQFFEKVRTLNKQSSWNGLNRRYFKTIVIIAKLNKIVKGFIVKYEVSLEVKIIFASYVTRDFLSLFNTFLIFLILYSINLLYSRIINFDFYVIKLFCIILLTKIHSKTLNQRYFNTIASTYTINLTFRPD
jgi:hypothetical protein